MTSTLIYIPEIAAVTLLLESVYLLLKNVEVFRRQNLEGKLFLKNE